MMWLSSGKAPSKAVFQSDADGPQHPGWKIPAGTMAAGESDTNQIMATASLPPS